MTEKSEMSLKLLMQFLIGFLIGIIVTALTVWSVYNYQENVKNDLLKSKIEHYENN